MDEIEGLNNNEFALLCSDLEQLAEWMQSEENKALLTPEQLAEALALIGE